LHWRAYHYGDALRFGFDVGPDAMARSLSDWLLTNPVFVSPGYAYDVALLYGAQWDNALIDERLVDNFEEFRRRYAYPRLVAGRAEDFFRDVERRFGTKLPVRRGDTGLYWEDGAASTAAELARYRTAQLAARATELLALWDGKTEAADADGTARIRRRADERRQIWRGRPGARVRRARGAGRRPAGRVRARHGAGRPRARLPGAGGARRHAEPPAGRRGGTRGADGELPRRARSRDGRDPFAHGERRSRAGEVRGLVGAERAGVCDGGRSECALDRRRARTSGRGARAARRDG